MATAAMVSLGEYLSTSYEPDCEWVDGELRQRSMGTNSHGTIQTFFIKYFGAREVDWGIRVVGEVRLKVSASRYRVPDVVLLNPDDPFDEILIEPPLLCIEVLSPDDRMHDMQDKIDDYLRMGVPAIWVVNPRLRRAFEVVGGGLMPTEDLQVRGTKIRVSATEVFAELNALEARKRI
jgi:Uma2 family endonuclease